MHPLNFRDVGEALELFLDSSPIPPGRLYRGGRFDTLTSADELGCPKTIVNLRRGPDPQHLSALQIHVPAPNDVENYNTTSKAVSAWVRRALGALASTADWPVYVHCTSGRDRTGIVIAALLLALGVSRDVVTQEYLLTTEPRLELFEVAVDGLIARPPVDARVLEALRRGFGVWA